MVRDNIKHIIKNMLSYFGLQINKKFQVYRILQKNVFKTYYFKNVLLIYTTKPFVSGLSMEHSNIYECFTVAECFKLLKYNVDVVDCNVSQRIDFSKYDVIFGMGTLMEKNFYQNPKISQTRIFYATGVNPIQSNILTTLKVREFAIINGRILLNSSRLIHESQHSQILLSDFVIVLGDEVTLGSYLKFDNKINNKSYNLNGFYFDTYDIELNKKSFSNAKNNYLWFGSSGLLHKGLDVLIEIFSENSGLQLHICGANEKEVEFFDYYKDFFLKSKNIHNHGFVDMKSNKFRQLMDMCAFTVFPSISEGSSPSLLNVMANGGLIPIYSYNCGLEKIKEFGWMLNSVTKDEVSRAIDESTKLSIIEIEEKANDIKSFVRANYSYENFNKNMLKILTHIITLINDRKKN